MNFFSGEVTHRDAAMSGVVVVRSRADRLPLRVGEKVGVREDGAGCPVALRASQ